MINPVPFTRLGYFAHTARHWRRALCLIGFAVALLITPGFADKETVQNQLSQYPLFHFSTAAIAAGNHKSRVEDPKTYPGGGDGEETAGDGNGIGGTGYKPGSGEGNGIGGTGIIGAITGFGSIFVNGYEVEIADDLAVAIKDGQTSASQLAIGQVVEIEANGDGTHVNASSVRVRHEVGGTIEKIDATRRTITLLGQNIQLPANSEGLNSSNGIAFENLRIGDRVDVSGFRRGDGTIEATRLDPLPSDEPDHLIGTLRKTRSATLTVAGLALSADHAINTNALNDGSEVRVVGQWRGHRFRARRIRARARLRFSNHVRHLAIEGYVRRTRGGLYALGHLPLTRPAAAHLRHRMIFSGRLDARRRFIQSDARAARLLKRRGRRIRALRRKLRQDAPPHWRRKWQNVPPKTRQRWLRKQQRKHRLRRRRNRNQ